MWPRSVIQPGLPACEVLVGIGDARVVLVLVFVVGRVGVGIAAQPEVLDELVALLIVGKVLEGLALLSVMIQTTSWSSQVL
jgi:mannose/fructose/N-acetylgalactosamine-specific phosphotransferase system component IID